MATNTGPASAPLVAFAVESPMSLLVAQGATAIIPFPIFLIQLAPGRATSEVSLALDIPPGAIVTRATITVSVQPAGSVRIGDVATVRAAAGNPKAKSKALVIDFGGLRTVSAVSSPESISTVQAWNGTAFADRAVSTGAGAFQEFNEVRTERLLLTHATAVDPSALAETAVVMTTPPADLQVSVAGTRVDIRPGVAPPTTVFDITAAAAAATPPVQVVVRSSVPGQIEVKPQVDVLRTHTVAFSDGPTRSLPVPEEGQVDLVLPLPHEATGWHIAAIQIPVRGDPGTSRTVPAPDPQPGGSVELTMDPDDSLLVRLPRAHTRRLARLLGVRLLVAAGTGGAELRGALRADKAGLPGDALPGGGLGPASVAAGAAPGWVSLMAARPQTVGSAAADIWADVQVTRGKVTWPLAAAPSASSTASPPAAPAAAPSTPAGAAPAPAAEGAALANARASLLRRMPNGRYRRLSVLSVGPGDIDTDNATIRVIGIPPPQVPIPALAVAALGSTPVPVFPTPAGVTVAITFDQPVLPPSPATGQPPDPDAAVELPVEIVSFTHGPYTFGPIRIAYKEG